ncbi:MAG: hypothetical protein RL199_303 [Pseudomonadota bacterium]|jgi:uncharacterized protein (DUF1015 family)
MPDIRPGHWVRYAGRANLSTVACPPYDVIDEAQHAALEAADPHNFVRLILPRAAPGEAAEARYRRARTLLDEWLSSGVLAEDDRPSVLAVEQAFDDHGTPRVRRGLFALLALSEFAEGRVLPHERTLSGPKQDRLGLLDAVGAQLSPIFVLYPDAENAVVASLADVFAAAPSHEAVLGGIKHRAWRIADPSRVSALTGLLAGRTGYIADGHHRYETALAYRRLSRERGVPVDGTPRDAIPAFLCGMSDPGLVIFPTHRLVHSLSFDPAKLESGLERFFDVRTPAADDRATVQEALAEAGRDRPAFALVEGTRPVRLLALKADAPLHEVVALPTHEALRLLDVSVLHAVVLEHLLGMSRLSQERQENLRYSKDFDQAVREAREGRAQLAFLLNSTRMDDVRRVCESGEVMPQKSTFFYPKIIDGFALQRL